MKQLISKASLILVILFLSINVKAQDSIVVNIVSNTFKISPTPLKADFSKDIFLIQKGKGCTGFRVEKIKDQNYNITKINDSVFKIDSASATATSLEFNLVCTNIPIKKEKVKNSAVITPGTTATTPEATTTTPGATTTTPGATAPTPGATESTGTAGAGTNTGGTFNGSDISADKYFALTGNGFPLYNTNERYSKKENMAFFYFGPSGNSLGPTPVNVDADDYLYIYLAVPTTELLNYSISVDGNYDAIDLSIRPSEPIDKANQQSKGIPTDTWTYITAKFGPFTSSFATIKIAHKGTTLSEKRIKINNLYNVAVGASFISTDLAKPEFDVFPLTSTTNTIKKVNDGKRTMATFNVIFYWKPTLDWVTGKLKGKENITRGRDILKEASFLERLNPTFGVSINSDWDENYFIGGVFEFARGGNLVFGGHYGKIQALVDKDFKLGETVFSGGKEDIKLTNVWKWGFFFGITLDTRIFNKIFNRQ